MPGGATPFEDVQSNAVRALLFGFREFWSRFSPFHSWAPKGYAVAPSGVDPPRMLHAGVLKKFEPLRPPGRSARRLLARGTGALVPLDRSWLALGNNPDRPVTLAQRDRQDDDWLAVRSCTWLRIPRDRDLFGDRGGRSRFS